MVAFIHETPAVQRVNPARIEMEWRRLRSVGVTPLTGTSHLGPPGEAERPERLLSAACSAT